MGKPFDLQIAPYRVFKAFLSDSPIDEEREEADEPWVQKAYEDLLADNLTSYRSFLWKYGEDGMVSRSSFARLSSCYAELVASSGLARVVERVLLSFPKKNEARRLKRDLLGEQHSGQMAELSRFSEDQRIEVLLLTKHSTSLNAKDILVRQRSALLWHQHRSSAVRLFHRALSRQKAQPCRDFLLGVMDAINGNEIPNLATSKSALLFIGEHRPELSYESEFWSADIPFDEYPDVLGGLVTKPNWRIEEALSAILGSKNHELVTHGYSLFPDGAIAGLLDWSNLNPEKASVLLHAGWLEKFRSHQSVVVEWLKLQKNQPSPAVLVLLASTIDPLSEYAYEIPIDPWIRVSTENKEYIQQQGEMAAFLYALGVAHQGPRGAQLVASSFEALHQALAYETLNYRGWRLIEGLLPDLAYDKWDNGEKLRRSVLNLFASRKWAIILLFESITREDVFKALLRSLKRVELTEYVRTSLTSDGSDLSRRLGKWKLKRLKRVIDIENELL